MQQCKVKYKIKTVESSCQILDNKRIPINEGEREIRKGNIPYYGANGLQGYINDYIFDDNLILLAEDGGYFDEYQTRPIAYKISGKSWVNNHAHILKPNTDYNFNYIFYNLEHKNILYYINGGTRAKLTQQELKNIKLILVDDIKQQEKIAQILSTCDSVIEKTEETIEKYKQIKAGVMQDLFTRGLDEDGKLRPKYQNAPELYKYSEELGRYIPKDWEVRDLEYYSTLIKDGTHGTHKDVNNGIPLLSAKDIVNGEILIPNDCRQISKKDYDIIHKNYKLEQGDILLTIVGTIGRTAVVKNCDKIYTFQRSVAIIKLKNPQYSNYFYYYFSFIDTQKQLLSLMNASAQGGLYLGQLSKIKILLPSQENEIISIKKHLLLIDYKIKQEQQYLSKYKQIKQGLMKKLLTPPADAEIVEE